MKRHFNARFSIDTEKKICNLYREGVYNGSVVLAKRFKVNPTTIHNILKAYGIESRNSVESQKGLQIGSKHPRYKGGNISPQGYKRIYIEYKGRRRLINEHMYLMEKKIGRRIKSTEIVHHKNENKIDNRMSNLILMTRAEHCKLHNPALIR